MSWFFPISVCTGIPINPHPGCFGSPRYGEKRHTGVDLYSKDCCPVVAVEDGTIVGIEPFTGKIDNSPWWKDTYCILVEGESGVVCYGEVTGEMHKGVGCTLRRGEFFTCVKRVILEGNERYEIDGWQPAMLHLELYPHGQYNASNGFEDFLIDPTPFLLGADQRPAMNLVYDKYKPEDAE